MNNSLLIPLLLSLITMTGWGIMDFLTGIMSRKINAAYGIFLTQFIGIFFIIPLFVFATGQKPINLLAPILLGAFNFLGWWIFMYATKVGNIAIVAPIGRIDFLFTSLLGIVFLQEKITITKILAMTIVFVGLLFLSVDWESIKKLNKTIVFRGVIPAILAALDVGITLFFLAPISRENGWYYTSLIMRSSVAITALLFLLVTNRSVLKTTQKIPWKIIFGIAIADVVGFCIYNYTVTFAEVSYVVVITSAASMVSVLLAFYFLKERLRLIQLVGVITIILGIIGLQLA